MEEILSKAEEMVDHIKEYVDNRTSSMKIKLAEKTSAVTAHIIAFAIVAVIFIFFLVFAGMALAHALADVTGKEWLGYLIVAGIYFITGIIIWFGKEKIIRLPVLNGILKQLFKEDEED